MPLWTELLRSVPLPTASLFLKKRDIANGSTSQFALTKASNLFIISIHHGVSLSKEWAILNVEGGGLSNKRKAIFYS